MIYPESSGLAISPCPPRGRGVERRSGRQARELRFQLADSRFEFRQPFLLLLDDCGRRLGDKAFVLQFGIALDDFRAQPRNFLRQTLALERDVDLHLQHELVIAYDSNWRAICLRVERCFVGNDLHFG